MSIIYCPVCGKNIKYNNTCTRCGYEEKTDYEVYPTLDRIKSDIKSIEYRRQENENKRFESYLKQHVYPFIMNNIGTVEKIQANEVPDEFVDNPEKTVAEIGQSEDQLKMINKLILLLKERIKQTELESEQIQKQKDLTIGETITFGSYWQDAESNEKKPIEWIVLDKKEDKLLLISKYALDCKPYNDEDEGTTWEKCSLRTWLNSGFIADAFRSQELGRIVETKVTADKNPKYNTNPGNDTNDKVFLLSIKEAEKYFSSKEARQCKPTEYTKENGVFVDNENGNCWLWLRSPGGADNRAAVVGTVGSVFSFGIDVNVGDISAVRPALWINLLS